MINYLFLSAALLGTTFTTAAKQIALTFDDAPLASSKVMSGTERTERIIQHLKNQGVDDALFFVTTANIVDELGTNRLKAYTNAGFHLAHHSHTHPSLNQITVEQYIEDFEQAQKRLAKFDNVLNLHRFPYLHYGETAAKRKTFDSYLVKQGFSYGYVTVDNFDWYINGQFVDAVTQGKTIDYDALEALYVDTLWDNIEFYDKIAIKQLGRSPKHVLLLHENDLAALYLDKLIKRIRNEGWEIISPTEAYTDDIAISYQPETFTFNKQGRIAAIAHHKGIAKSELRHQNENTDFLKQQISNKKIFKSNK